MKKEETFWERCRRIKRQYDSRGGAGSGRRSGEMRTVVLSIPVDLYARLRLEGNCLSTSPERVAEQWLATLHRVRVSYTPPIQSSLESSGSSSGSSQASDGESPCREG